MPNTQHNTSEPKRLGKGSSLDGNSIIGRSLLHEELSLPIAVLYRSRINNNIQWMQRFADEYKVKLAPHGKTTMAPALFHQQLDAGAWGMSLATVQQTLIAYSAGIPRVLMANQLVGKRNMEVIADLLASGRFDFYCLVDSPENVRQLGEFYANRGLSLQVLLEVGVENGRCGCRNSEQVSAVIESIAEYSSLHLVGVETYEGVVESDSKGSQIKTHLNSIKDIFKNLLSENVFDSNNVILSGAGSAWYDLVAQSFAEFSHDERVIPVIRPGCYAVHDTGIYQDAQRAVISRLESEDRLPKGELKSSLELWAYVQSIPEPGCAIIAMGKRDVAFDAGLPSPRCVYFPSAKKFEDLDDCWQLESIMDQHCKMRYPESAPLSVGDIVTFSTSHPCLTFDKWKQVAVIDDDYRVVDHIDTFF